MLCALGDLLLDIVVRLEQPFVPGDDTQARTTVGAGGQAANVAAWAGELGAEARLIARRSDDPAGRLAAAELEARGVTLLGPVGSGRAGVVVSIARGDEERSMLTDRGASPELAAGDIDVEWLRGCDVFHLSGYALLLGPIVEAGARAAGAARAQGARVSVDLASAEGIRALGAERLLGRLGELVPDVVFAGEHELAALGREPQAQTLVVKRGAGGITLVSSGRRQEYPAAPADVLEATGAGDALAAGFLVGGVERGLAAAARCLAKAGAMP